MLSGTISRRTNCLEQQETMAPGPSSFPPPLCGPPLISAHILLSSPILFPLSLFLYFLPLSVTLQCLFDSWLTQKEELVRSIKTPNLKDQAEMVACLRRLAVSPRPISFHLATKKNICDITFCVSAQTLKAELEVKRPTMDKLCSMSQDLLSSVKNKEVASKLEARLDSFAQRWDRLIQGLELSSTQVHFMARNKRLCMQVLLQYNQVYDTNDSPHNNARYYIPCLGM